MGDDRVLPRSRYLRGPLVQTPPQASTGLFHPASHRLGDGKRCEPLTVTDIFSRYLVKVAATASTREEEARPLFEQAFEEYGLPEVIRSDSGPPFASPGLTGLTALGVWWTRLGIAHERIDAGSRSRTAATSACTSP
ncbi:MAG: transposase family protein [Rhodospirillales bacterium]|nr:transposase family protein [Rhodospirillales bacterium]